jgi:hypothetical protein
MFPRVFYSTFLEGKERKRGILLYPGLTYVQSPATPRRFGVPDFGIRRFAAGLRRFGLSYKSVLHRVFTQ